jgi:integrase
MSCHLGYRRNKTGAGSWVARYYDGDKYTKHTLGQADDSLTADGVDVLDFTQAQDSAREWYAEQARRSAGLEPDESEPYTVARCMADYLDWMETHRKGAESTRYSVKAHILPALGVVEVGALTTTAIRRWHQQLAESAPRVRTVKGKPQQTRPVEGPEGKRSRQATANRVLAMLRAALNFAYREGRVASDAAWRRVKPFRDADKPKVRFLDHSEAGRLLNTCKPDFRQLVRAALLTGARFGELVALRVSDYSPDSRAVHIAESKSSKARHVFLSDEGAAYFESLTAGRPGAERLFVRSDAEPWGPSHQHRRMKDACSTAKIEPAISFHLLRHTYASHYLMSGGSLPGLARQLGHADTRMTTRHYGHLAESWRAEEARRHAPAFGGDPGNVVRLDGARRTASAP